MLWQITMKRKKTILLCFALLGSIATMAQRTEQLPLKSFTGHWKLDIDSVKRFEEWKLITSNHLKGWHYKIQQQDTIPMEFLEIRKIKGKWAYVVRAAGESKEKEVLFFLTKVKEGSYYFENKANEYPKRIVYELVDTKKMNAWIDEGDVPNSFRLNFPFIKLN